MLSAERERQDDVAKTAAATIDVMHARSDELEDGLADAKAGEAEQRAAAVELKDELDSAHETIISLRNEIGGVSLLNERLEQRMSQRDDEVKEKDGRLRELEELYAQAMSTAAQCEAASMKSMQHADDLSQVVINAVVCCEQEHNNNKVFRT